MLHLSPAFRLLSSMLRCKKGMGSRDGITLATQTQKWVFGSILSTCVVFLGKTLYSHSASIRVYKWVLVNLMLSAVDNHPILGE